MFPRSSAHWSTLVIARGITAARRNAFARLFRRRPRWRRQVLGRKTLNRLIALGDRLRLAIRFRSFSPTRSVIVLGLRGHTARRPSVRARPFVRRLVCISGRDPVRFNAYLAPGFCRIHRHARGIVHRSRWFPVRRCRSLHPRLKVRNPMVYRAATHRGTQYKKQHGHQDRQQRDSSRTAFLLTSVDPNLRRAWLGGKHRVLAKLKVMRRCFSRHTPRANLLSTIGNGARRVANHANARSTCRPRRWSLLLG